MHYSIPLLTSAVFLSACGGGGGTTDGGGGTTDGGGGSGDPQVFTSFDNAPDNGVVRLQGAAITAAYTYDILRDIIFIGQIIDDDNAYVDLTYTNGFVTRIVVGNTSAPLDLNFEDGDVAFDLGLLQVAQSADGQDRLAIANDVLLGYQYQDFGLWVNGYNTGAGTVGAGSFGSLSDAGDLPNPGVNPTVTYNGYAAGFLADDTGFYAATTSNTQITAHFDTTEVTVSTINTRLLDIDTFEDLGGADLLDFSGTGTISGATFDATLTSGLTVGTLEGQFYGPNAEEVGGTFQATGNGIVHVGAFGAD